MILPLALVGRSRGSEKDRRPLGLQLMLHRPVGELNGRRTGTCEPNRFVVGLSCCQVNAQLCRPMRSHSSHLSSLHRTVSFVTESSGLWDDPTFPVLSYRLSAILSDAVVQVSQLVLFCRTGTRTAGPEFAASSTVVGYFMVCSVTHRVHLYVLT